MRINRSRIGWSRPVLMLAAVISVSNWVTEVKAQVFFEPSVEYAVPVVATRVYAYRPVTVFSTPTVVVAPRPVVVYSAPVVVTQPYVAYSAPVVALPAAAPRVSRDRVRTNVYGTQIYDHHSRGPGYGHLHTHGRDGHHGYHERGRLGH